LRTRCQRLGSTYEFAPYNNEVTFQLSSARDLLPGDALNSTPRAVHQLDRR